MDVMVLVPSKKAERAREGPDNGIGPAAERTQAFSGRG
jgi:hypothetical protein